ncbi:hypothetical protein D3C72_1873490 [compost metagenome]
MAAQQPARQRGVSVAPGGAAEAVGHLDAAAVFKRNQADPTDGGAIGQDGPMADVGMRFAQPRQQFLAPRLGGGFDARAVPHDRRVGLHRQNHGHIVDLYAAQGHAGGGAGHGRWGRMLGHSR